MGMDVYGKAPCSETGEYFRSNIWGWRGLWRYCCDLIPEIISDELALACTFNDGNGLDSEGAYKLGRTLLDEIEAGRTKNYQDEFNESLAAIPLEDCQWCNATGIRTDEVGINQHMPERELDDVQKVVLGRTHGWCNGCNGNGKHESFLTSYFFDVEHVKEFADFCIDSGGFEVW